MNCQEADELVAPLVLGALSPAQNDRLDAHLAACRQHDATIRELASAVHGLAAAADELTPPAPLKARVLRDAVRPAATGFRLRERLRGWLPLRGPGLRLASASGLLSLAVVLMALNLFLAFSPGGDGNEMFTRELQQGSARATMLYIDGLDVCIISAEGLPPLPPEQAYQLWAMTKNGLESRGLLSALQGGSGVALVTGEMSRTMPVFVTREPVGGSPAPSGATVLTTR